MNLKTRILNLIFLLLFTVGCESLMPPEKRVYSGTVPLREKENLESWIASKKAQHKESFIASRYEENSFNGKFYSQKKFSDNHFQSCSFVVYQKEKSLYLRNLTYVLDYGCQSNLNFSDKCGKVRGIVGPTGDKDFQEILNPCIEEFLETK